MILKSFGCSFIFGTDLADDISNQCFDFYNNGMYINPSRLTWPALLADASGHDYVSRALPGIGNLQIFETVLEEVEKKDDAIFVIQWTWIERFDYINLHKGDWDNKWNTIAPGTETDTSKLYYKYLHSQYQDKLMSLIYIKTAIDTLRQNNIPFIMTYIDDLVFESKWHTSPAIENLQTYVLPHMISFEGQNFLDWAKKKGFPISETLHPLEPAHRAAFELIKSYNLV